MTIFEDPTLLDAADLAGAGVTLTRKGRDERLVTIHTRAPLRGLICITVAVAAPIALGRAADVPVGMVALLTAPIALLGLWLGAAYLLNDMRLLIGPDRTEVAYGPVPLPTRPTRRLGRLARISSSAHTEVVHARNAAGQPSGGARTLHHMELAAVDEDGERAIIWTEGPHLTNLLGRHVPADLLRVMTRLPELLEEGPAARPEVKAPRPGGCPRDQRALEAVDDAIVTKRCELCGGSLVGAEVMQGFITDTLGLSMADVAELAQHIGGRIVPCPACDGEMRTVQLRGLQLEVCLSCAAAWAEFDELRALSAQLER